MKDVNQALRKAYVTALNNIFHDNKQVRVFYQQAPKEITDKNYITFGGISSNDISTKQTSDTQTSMEVKIFTYENGYNNGDAADLIADQVIQAIYPKPTSTLTLEGTVQMVSTEMTGDSVQAWTQEGQRVYVDRTLIFRHRLFIK